MNTSRALFALIAALLVLLSPALSQSTWKIVQKDFTTIAMSNAFLTETDGWIVGGTAGMQPLFLYSTDGGSTLTNYGVENVNEGAFMSIAMADANNGVAGALGFGPLICGAYTNNGLNWTQTHEGKDILCESQDAAAPDSNTLILIGQWTTLEDPSGDGIQISTDAGSTFTGINWNQGTTSRYGSFISKDFGFITGGQWPEDDSEDEVFGKSKDLSMHLHFDGKRVTRKPIKSTNEFNGYWGVIAQVTNAGQNFKTMVNLTNEGLYFNQISCTDENNCWAVAEGNDISSGNVTAWIVATTDGWNTWDTQLTFNGGSLMAIEMLSPTFGWAGGASVVGEEDGAIFQTTDGKTWTLNASPKNFFVTDFSVIDQNTAFASGMTSFGLSSFARYANY